MLNECPLHSSLCEVTIIVTFYKGLICSWFSRALVCCVKNEPHSLGVDLLKGRLNPEFLQQNDVRCHITFYSNFLFSPNVNLHTIPLHTRPPSEFFGCYLVHREIGNYCGIGVSFVCSVSLYCLPQSSYRLSPTLASLLFIYLFVVLFHLITLFRARSDLGQPCSVTVWTVHLCCCLVLAVVFINVLKQALCWFTASHLMDSQWPLHLSVQIVEPFRGKRLSFLISQE